MNSGSAGAAGVSSVVVNIAGEVIDDNESVSATLEGTRTAATETQANAGSEPGTETKAAGRRFYTIKPGDTLSAIAAQFDTTTAASRVVEHLIHLEQEQAFKEAQRARREMEDALSLVRGFLAIGPNPQALTHLARDAAEFVARVEARR